MNLCYNPAGGDEGAEGYRELDAVLQDVKSLLSPAGYISSLGLEPYPWQAEALDPTLERLLLLCARQSGKSTVVAGKALWKAKYFPGSLILLISPSEKQSKEVMKKIELFMSGDSELGSLRSDSTFEKQLHNLSRIVALPGSEKSARSYSAPAMIIVDEASRVLDETYRAIRPMMTGTRCELILMSTPFGKRGFFWKAWSEQNYWRKIMVKAPCRIADGKLSEAHDDEALRRQYPGVSAYYSPRHTQSFLREELQTHGITSFQQEYLVEFVQPEGSLFRFEDIQASLRPVEGLRRFNVRGDIKTLEV